MNEFGFLYEVTQCLRGDEKDTVFLTSKDGSKRYRMEFAANNSDVLLEAFDISSGRRKKIPERYNVQYLTEIARLYLRRYPAPA